MDHRVVQVELPNGTVALVRALDVEPEPGRRGASKTAAPKAVTEAFDFGGVAATLEGLSEAMQSALEKATPDRFVLEVGLDVVLRSGKLMGLIVDGGGSAALRVTLEWNGGRGG